MTQRIRVGLIGAGDNTRRRHIPGLLAVEGDRELRGDHRPTLTVYPEAFLRSVRLLAAAVTVSAALLTTSETPGVALV